MVSANTFAAPVIDIAPNVSATDCISDNLGGYNSGTVFYAANWKPIEYTIEYVHNGGAFPMGVIVPTTYNIETPDITLPQPVKDGFAFLGWCTDAQLTNCAKPGVIPTGSTGNKKFYAKWEFACNPEHWLHVGDEKVCLYESKQTSPAVVVDVNGNKRYLMLSEDDTMPMNSDTDKKMRVQYKGKVYNAHDKSVNQ